MMSYMGAEDFENNMTQRQGKTLIQRAGLPDVSGKNGHFSMKNCSVVNGIHKDDNSKNHQRNEDLKMRSSTSKEAAFIGGHQQHPRHHHKHHHRHHSKGKVRKESGRMDRFSRTAAVLRQAGLMKLTLQISQLIKTNEELQSEIDNLQNESLQFSEHLKRQLQERLKDDTNGNVQLQEKK